METKYWNRTKFGQKIGKNPKTLREWERDGILKSKTDIHGNPYYDQSHIEQLIKADNERGRKIYKNTKLKSLLKSLNKSKEELLLKAKPFSEILMEKELIQEDLINGSGLIDVNLDYDEDGGGTLTMYSEPSIPDEVKSQYLERIFTSLKLVRKHMSIPMDILLMFNRLKFILVEDVSLYTPKEVVQNMGAQPRGWFDITSWTILLPVGTTANLSHEIIHSLDYLAGMIWYKKDIAFSKAVYNKYKKQEGKYPKDIRENELNQIEELMANIIDSSEEYIYRLEHDAEDLGYNSAWKKYAVDIEEIMARIGEKNI